MRFCPPKYHGSVINGSWLRAIREDAGITAKAMGQRLGYSASFVASIESEARPCPVAVVSAYEALEQKGI